MSCWARLRLLLTQLKTCGNLNLAPPWGPWDRPDAAVPRARCDNAPPPARRPQSATTAANTPCAATPQPAAARPPLAPPGTLHPPRVLFRALRPDENPRALAPRCTTGAATPNDHVHQRRSTPSLYVSHTGSPAIALYYARRYTALCPRVVRVDTRALDMDPLVPLTTPHA